VSSLLIPDSVVAMLYTLTEIHSANVGFLALPGIDGVQRSASLASSILAMTSIVVGVHHIWRHRGKTDANLEDAAVYLDHEHKFGDLELAITACFLSLPIAALLWSVLCFTVSIAAFCIQNSDVHGKIILAVVLGVVGTCACGTLVFFWHIWKDPPYKEREEEYHLDVRLNIDPPTLKKKLATRLKKGLRLKTKVDEIQDEENGSIPSDDTA